MIELKAEHLSTTSTLYKMSKNVHNFQFKKARKHLPVKIESNSNKHIFQSFDSYSTRSFSARTFILLVRERTLRGMPFGLSDPCSCNPCNTTANPDQFDSLHHLQNQNVRNTPVVWATPLVETTSLVWATPLV